MLYVARSRDCVNERVTVSGLTDTESEDEDKHLLVDWKGNGGRVSLVQQSLPFKQVKRRDRLKTTNSLLPTYKETHIPTSAPGTISTDVIVPEDKLVVVKPTLGAVKTIPEVLSRPKLVVSLSDSDVSAPSRSAIKRPSNNSHRLNPSGFHLLCLLYDFEREYALLIILYVDSSTKSVNRSVSVGSRGQYRRLDQVLTVLVSSTLPVLQSNMSFEPHDAYDIVDVLL